MTKYRFIDTKRKFKDSVYPWAVAIMIPILIYIMSLGSLYLTIFFILLEMLFVFLLGRDIRPIAVKSLGDYEYQRIPIRDLEDFHDDMIKVGVCGPSKVGKTTLINALSLSKAQNERTSETFAYIARSRNNSKQFIVYVDGKGQYHDGQFMIAKTTDPIIVLLDHNISENNNEISDLRLGTTFAFIEQLRLSLEKTKTYPKRVLIVLNKSDLWIKLSDKEIKQLKSWQIDIKQKWVSYLGHRSEITIHQISCKKIEDIINLLKDLNI